MLAFQTSKINFKNVEGVYIFLVIREVLKLNSTVGETSEIPWLLIQNILLQILMCFRNSSNRCQSLKRGQTQKPTHGVWLEFWHINIVSSSKILKNFAALSLPPSFIPQETRTEPVWVSSGCFLCFLQSIFVYMLLKSFLHSFSRIISVILLLCASPQLLLPIPSSLAKEAYYRYYSVSSGRTHKVIIFCCSTCPFPQGFNLPWPHWPFARIWIGCVPMHRVRLSVIACEIIVLIVIWLFFLSWLLVIYFLCCSLYFFNCCLLPKTT